jgi:small subunit ribosomal protein S16
MALVIRLRRLGAKSQPFFRIAVTETATARDGRFVEEIGWYDPKKAGTNSNVDGERARHWLSKGAKPSDTVRNIFKEHGLIGPGRAPKTAAPKPKPAAAPEPEPAAQPEPEAPQAQPEAPPQPEPETPQAAEAAGDEKQE